MALRDLIVAFQAVDDINTRLSALEANAAQIEKRRDDVRADIVEQRQALKAARQNLAAIAKAELSAELSRA